MVTEGPVAPRHSLFFYLLSAPIKLGPQVALFDVEAGLVVFGDSCFSVKTNKTRGKTVLVFPLVLSCFGLLCSKFGHNKKDVKSKSFFIDLCKPILKSMLFRPNFRSNFSDRKRTPIRL